MSDSAFNRPRRQFEPRMHDERGRELGGRQSRAPDESATERRDPGAEALSELARLISQPDPFAPVTAHANEARNADGRVVDMPSSSNSPDRWAQDPSVRPPTLYPAQSRDRAYDVRLNDEHDDHGDRPEDHPHPVYGREDEYLEVESGEDDDYEYEEHEHPDDSESGFNRRKSTKVVVAVLGLAVFGSAAAFGYRTVFKADPSGSAPIIRADNSPTKVIPAGTDANARPVNERPGDNSSERLVRRDEDPVDVGASLRSGASGDVGASGAVPDTAGPPTATGPAASGPGSPSDTRRVRTVTIRADQGAASPERTAAPRAAPPPQPPPPPPPRQTAALPAPTTSVTPTAIAPEAAAPRAVEAGGFVVQLSAQRSEAEAQTAFRTLQAKYSVLNGRQLLVRRKDQGEKGIFYAAQVGPFGAKSDADQLCETLKSAGGACFVQKN
jgi:hypothetical protein